MFLLHELHEVVGAREDAFEEALRDDWLPVLTATGDARPLHALKQTHGTGSSYVVITLTALRDGAAWERLTHSVDSGELRDVACHLDSLRHDVTAKVMLPLPWSPPTEVDFDAPPATFAPGDGRPPLFMEDTVWPHEGKLEEYVAAAGTHYASEIAAADEEGRSLLRIGPRPRPQERQRHRPNEEDGNDRPCDEHEGEPAGGWCVHERLRMSASTVGIDLPN